VSRKLQAVADRMDASPNGLPLAACSLQLEALLALVRKSPYFTRLIKLDFQHYN
jgi:hypothetical protein